jgi:hypothetical protein
MLHGIATLFCTGFIGTVLEFDTMMGASGPFLGSANPISDVNGGGVPWVLNRGHGELRSDGDLRVEVEGLIIPSIRRSRAQPRAVFPRRCELYHCR